MQPGSPQTQLLLGLRPAQEPRFDNFVCGSNQEACSNVRNLVSPRTPGAVYLWGDSGSGKTHLLGAAAFAASPASGGRRPQVWITNALACAEIQVAPDTLVIADDVSALDAEHQTLLFRLFNSARIAGLAFLLADRLPPARLALRDDLRTRLGQTLIFCLAPLSDTDRSCALQRHALMRGMRLDDSLVNYLLRHSRRDLPTLMSLLDELDRSSLELKRQPTLPMLRELMQSQLNLD